MTSTYKAVEVSAPGTLRVVERQVSEPATGQVRIRVEACGICHTDAATVTGIYPGLKLPRVPGHEVVGRIEALGSGVSRWKIGQRVGVGLIAGEDGVCEPCRRGDTVNCQNPVASGVTADGGYAEVMIAEARALSSVPDELTSAEAAPLLCAGVTTYNALRNAGLRGGDLVAVQGIGGLGHLGVQFARQMGFHTVAIGERSFFHFVSVFSSNQINTQHAPPCRPRSPHSLWNCPLCGGIMHVVERLSAAQLLLRSPPHPGRCAA